MNEFNEWVRAQGFDPETLSEAQRKSFNALWRASLNPAAAVPATLPATGAASEATGTTSAEAALDAIVARTRAENDRRQAITERCSHYLTAEPSKVATFEAIARQAIEGNWTAQRTDLEMLRCSRGPGPMLLSTSAPQVTADVIEAAVCRAGSLGSKVMEQDFSERTLETLDRTYKRGVGLQQLVGIAARQNGGWRGDSVKGDLRSALRAAFREADAPSYSPRAEGPSTLDIGGILSNVANKFLREAFMYVEGGYRRFTAVRTVSDFKQISSYSLTGDNTYEKVPAGGKLKHGTLGNETYHNQADTYGKILGVDRRDLINDDLNALTGVGKRLGRGGALKINEVFWTEFLADPSTFYTAGRGNYDDGTDTAFGNDGLVAANVIWRAKTDPDGKPLGSAAKFLIIPPSHEMAAWRLMNSMFFGTTGADGEKNPWAGKYEVVTSTYLANAAMGGGYSAVAWYMVADPADLPVIETAFLDGVEMPTIEAVEMDGDQLGMAMRAYWDFGVAKQEYRGALKLKGEA